MRVLLMRVRSMRVLLMREQRVLLMRLCRWRAVRAAWARVFPA